MLRVAVLQCRSSADKKSNIDKAKEWIKRAKDLGCKLAILPECFNSPYGINHFPLYCETIPGETTNGIREAAETNKIWVIAGTIPERRGEQLFNTCTVFDPQGTVVALYRKIHLFDVDIPGQITFSESKVLSEGTLPSHFDIDDFRIGLGVCFDLRFPELALHYSQQGCNILVYPSAFSAATGPKYWNLLQRARAVDTQSYVITCSPAANEHGDFKSYGHSMVVAPDGTIVKEIEGDHEDIITVDIDIKSVVEERQRIPILSKKKMNNYSFS